STHSARYSASRQNSAAPLRTSNLRIRKHKGSASCGAFVCLIILNSQGLVFGSGLGRLLFLLVVGLWILLLVLRICFRVHAEGFLAEVANEFGGLVVDCSKLLQDRDVIPSGYH